MFLQVRFMGLAFGGKELVFEEDPTLNLRKVHYRLIRDKGLTLVSSTQHLHSAMCACFDRVGVLWLALVGSVFTNVGMSAEHAAALGAMAVARRTCMAATAQPGAAHHAYAGMWPAQLDAVCVCCVVQDHWEKFVGLFDKTLNQLEREIPEETRAAATRSIHATKHYFVPIGQETEYTNSSIAALPIPDAPVAGAVQEQQQQVQA
jgi:hypothetical protein